MASPLILRITSTFGNTGTKQAVTEIQSVTRAVDNSGRAARSSFSDFERMTAGLAGVRIEAGKTGIGVTNTFGDIRREAGQLISLFRLVRRIAIIGSIITAPVAIAVKSVIELEQALQPLSTTLAQLGQNASAQKSAIVSFAKSLELTSGTKLAESLGGLQAYIKATKDSSNSLQALSTAETLHFATGRKVAEILGALGDAQKGNVDSLSSLTDKRKEDIFALVQQGTLLSELSKEFSGPAKDGANSLSNVLGTTTRKLKTFGVEVSKAILTHLPTVGPTIFFTRLSDAATKAKSDITRFNETLTLANETGRTFKLGNLEDSLRTLGQLKSELQDIQTIISTQPNITKQQLDLLIKNRQVTQEQVDLVSKLIVQERELPTAQRAILSAQTAINQNQINFLTTRSRLDRPGSRGDSSTTRRQQELIQEEAIAKQKLAITNARQKIQQAREQHDGAVAAELALNVQKELELSILKISEDTQKEISNLKEKELRNSIAISQTELEIFRRTEEAKLSITKTTLQDRIDEEQKISDKIIAKQIEIVIKQKQQERDTLLAQGQLTNQQELRLATELQNDIEKIRESAANDQATKQIKFALLSSLEKAAIKKRQQDIAQIEQEIINKGGVERISEVTKTRIKNLKAEQDIIQAQIQATRATTGTTESETFTKESDRLIRDQATKSAKTQNEARVAAEVQALTRFNAAYEAQVAIIQQKKVTVPITLDPKVDLGSLELLALQIASVIVSKLKEVTGKTTSEQAGQILISGAPQGGSE